MISSERFIKKLKSKGVSYFYGVPDSLLKKLTANLVKEKSHFISANEGSAVAEAIGTYLRTKKLSLVYMQNSGLGNAINPLLSIADKKVYSIPIVLMIGWRGEPGISDEPQHEVMGSITKELLKLIKIPFLIVDKNLKLKKLDKIIKICKKEKKPIALLVKLNSFSSENKSKFKENNKILRYDFLETFLKCIHPGDKIFSTTGYTSREIYSIRKKINDQNIGSDFYMVGGMGHTSSVASAYSALNKKGKKRVYCIDGDGSMLMHLGSLPYASTRNKNFKYILLNNNTHESVGYHFTNSKYINFKAFSSSIGFKNFMLLKNKKEIKKKLKKFLKYKTNSFLEVRIMTKSMSNLPRPKKLINLKDKFIKCQN